MPTFPASVLKVDLDHWVDPRPTWDPDVDFIVLEGVEAWHGREDRVRDLTHPRMLGGPLQRHQGSQVDPCPVCQGIELRRSPDRLGLIQCLHCDRTSIDHYSDHWGLDVGFRLNDDYIASMNDRDVRHADVNEDDPIRTMSDEDVAQNRALRKLERERRRSTLSNPVRVTPTQEVVAPVLAGEPE
jgi:hypothetical protein